MNDDIDRQDTTMLDFFMKMMMLLIWKRQMRAANGRQAHRVSFFKAGHFVDQVAKPPRYAL